MLKPLHETPSFEPSRQHPRPARDAGWEATRVQPATQIMREPGAAGAGDAARELGSRVDAVQWELFVVTSPAEAVRMQLEHLRPEYIALHDIGTASSRRLLGGLAGAAGTVVQKLAIRRQGYGVSLATLEFVELPVAGAPPLRLYTTQIDGDTATRHDLAQVLLAHSRLGVVMVGELPTHALAAAFKPLQQAIAEGPWPNRELLVLPLGAATGIAAQAAELGIGRAVQVRATPQVSKPAEAWNYVSGSWNRLREALAPTGVRLPAIAGAAGAAGTAAAAAPSTPALPTVTSPIPLEPMPDVPAAPGPRPGAGSPLAHYVQQVGEIKGMVSCCVFELATQRPVAHAGGRPGPAALAAHGAALYQSLVATAKAMGLGAARPDTAITLGAHHLLLHPVPGQPGLALHAVLDKSATNVMLARMHLQRLDDALAPRSAAP